MANIENISQATDALSKYLDRHSLSVDLIIVSLINLNIIDDMKAALVDVPGIAMDICTRPDMIEKVFEVIKEARPSTLFLVSDGPRESVPTDKERIAASRELLKKLIGIVLFKQVVF